MAIMQDKLKLAKMIPTKRNNVFSAWTTPQAIQKWFCPEDMKVVMQEWNFQVDRNYRISMVDKHDEHFTTYGIFKEIVLNKKIVMTFGWDSPDRAETLLTFNLIDKGSSTEVILMHENFVDPEQVKRHEEGWTSTLENLANQFGLKEIG